MAYTENLQQAMDNGYKVSQLWDINTRVISSTEKLNDKGSLMRGTVYVEWAFWLNSNVQEHAFIAVFDNGTDITHPNFSDLKSSLGITADLVLTQGGTQFDVKMSEWESEDQSRTVGLVGLYLVYLDNDDWIKVYDTKVNQTTVSEHTFPVHKDTSFKILVQEGFEYEECVFDINGPIPLTKKVLCADFKRVDLKISMPTEVTCRVFLSGRNLDKVWLKYI